MRTFVFLVLVACESSYGANDPKPASPVADSGAPDVTPDVTPPPVFLTNADFERGCIAWSTKAATSADDETIFRSGKTACRVCAMTGGSGLPFQISQRITKVVKPGDRFLIEAFVHGPQDASITSFDTLARVELKGADETYLKAVDGNAITPGASWVRTGVTVEVPEGAAKIDITVVSNGTQGKCFVVDDVSVEQL